MVAPAQSQACAVLLNEDLQGGCTCGAITVHNPFKRGIAEAHARCEATPVAARVTGHAAG